MRLRRNQGTNNNNHNQRPIDIDSRERVRHRSHPPPPLQSSVLCYFAAHDCGAAFAYIHVYLFFVLPCARARATVT